MKREILLTIALVFMLTQSCDFHGGNIIIVKEATADVRTNFVADELAGFLKEIYPTNHFIVQTSIPDKGDYILLGTKKGMPVLKGYIEEELEEEGGFVVRNVAAGNQRIGIICGSDSRGVLDGVYSLLEQKLNYGFYLDYNATENIEQGKFDFELWDLEATPLIKDRLTFNWHNFISGCTAWNWKEWKRWILQSARMRYTGVMVHTYGWSPLTEFSFNGITKDVQYIQNTRNGSNWGVKHTEDVRSLLGGELFDEEGPVFGADISKIGFNGVTMENRVEHAKDLMRKVSLYAKDTVGMDFIFCWDVDTKYCNDQDQILTLPKKDRYYESTTEQWLARPDTEAGYQFYKAQVDMLLNDYPGITEIVVWFRHSESTAFGGLMLNLDVEELPAEWRAEYDAADASGKTWAAAPTLAIAKVADAFQRALEELGREEVELGFGSWWFNDESHHHLFEAANEFFDPKIRAYFTDYNMDFGESESYRERILPTGQKRELTVIEWAHHDDGKYCGRPYNPPSDFYTKLTKDVQASGFGVLHWMTRPLDLPFKSMQNQVWSNSLNEDFSVTINRLALDFFGEKAADEMTNYLEEWMQNAPQFNRETGPRLAFGIKDKEEVVTGVEKRLEMLSAVDTAELSDVALERYKFFRGHEEWIRLFYLADESGDVELQKEAIRKYAEKISYEQITRGELGILVQHNLKWLEGKGEGLRETD